MSTTIRLVVTAALIALTYAGVHAIRQRGMPTGVRLPDRELLPASLGPWTGAEGERDLEAFPAGGAAMSAARVYRNPSGDVISVYAAVWEEYRIKLPHLPEYCYAGVGYRVIAQDDMQLQGADSSTAAGRLLTLERDGQRVCVLYWYQLGDSILLDEMALRRAMWRLRRAKDWPPPIKVMIQAPAHDLERAKARLQSIAPPLLVWTREL